MGCKHKGDVTAVREVLWPGVTVIRYTKMQHILGRCDSHVMCEAIEGV